MSYFYANLGPCWIGTTYEIFGVAYNTIFQYRSISIKLKDSILKSSIYLCIAVIAAAGFVFLTLDFLDYAMNAKADTDPYYDMLGNKLLPYEVLPYRFFAFLAVVMCLVGVLMSACGVVILCLDLKHECMKFINKKR